MALANKYRPSKFSEVIGQEAAVVALKNIIKNQNFHNGYIFAGTRGVGKTTLGRLFAKALNCSNYDLESGSTCNVCANCEAIQTNSYLDLIEIDAASRTGVDDMRELLESVQYRPSQGNYKVYLIDEVHMLSIQSFNALLKTLEEPPAHVIFILATTESNKIPKTIISRCLQFNLKIVPDGQIAENLHKVFDNEGVKYDDKSLDLLVELAKGSVRDSLTLADQAMSHCDNNLNESEISKLHGVLDLSSTGKLFEAIFSNDVNEVTVELERYQSLDVNYEILFDRALKFLHAEIIRNLKDKDGDAQDMHLYYQFFTNGLIDGKQTGNIRDSFDIAVLRCLSFSENQITVKKKQTESAVKTAEITEEKIQPTPAPEIKKEAQPQEKEEKKITTNNWLNIFDEIDLSGPARAFFSNLQLDKVEDTKLFFSGSDMFTSRITRENIDDLIISLNKVGYTNCEVVIEATEAAVKTPSTAWEKKRKEEILAFKKEILESDLLVNLKHNFGEEITQDKFQVIDHEE